MKEISFDFLDAYSNKVQRVRKRRKLYMRPHEMEMNRTRQEQKKFK
jgi:hypothetical protein